MVNLLITGAVSNPEKVIEQLRRIKIGINIYFIQNELEPIAPNIPVDKINAVVCNGLFLHNDIDIFSSLEFIQVTSAGLERLPLDKIKQRNIKLYNARGIYSIPMAEWAISKILEIYKQSHSFYNSQQQRRWIKSRDIKELNESKAIVIGVGSVGIEVAKRLWAFGVDVVGVDIEDVNSMYFSASYNIDQIRMAISDRDIIVLTLPLTVQTYNLFNKSLFDSINKDAVLVNISRGAIVCEQDLIEALSSKRLMAAALDVFEEEPLRINSPLWNMENTIITPHNSFVSDKVATRFCTLMINNFTKYYETKKQGLCSDFS